MDTNTRLEVLRLAVTTAEAPGDVTSVLARASAFADFVEPPVIEKQPDVLVRGPQRLSAAELAVRDAMIEKQPDEADPIDPNATAPAESQDPPAS